MNMYTLPETEKLLVYTIDSYGDEDVEIGGNGSITNGLLNFTIGTPSELTDITTAFTWEGLSDFSYSNFNISDNEANVAILHLRPSGGSYYAVVPVVDFFNYMQGGDYVSYIYVDRDVVITGDGKANFIITTTDLNLNLKKGWSSLYSRGGIYDNTPHILSLANPSYLRWYIYAYYFGSGGKTGPSLPSIRH